MIDPVIRQVTMSSISKSDLWSEESDQKDQLDDPKIKPIIEFKESSVTESPPGKTSSLPILQRSVTEFFGIFPSEKWCLISQMGI
ncbi:hypothetical protein TNCV_2285071 [Trichonephila clavipes]|nr:hypothetical protein TNCV_2285071 [Trichonephila clavipes]